MVETRVEKSPAERQEVLLEALRARRFLTVTSAWEVGHYHGFYIGGDASVAKSDLQALVQRRQAKKTDGFWRHAHEPDHIRSKYKVWADYWEPI